MKNVPQGEIKTIKEKRAKKKKKELEQYSGMENRSKVQRV